MAQNERAKTTVYLDGKQAEAALEALGNKAQELRRDLKAAQKAGDNIKMKGIERELKRVEAAQRSMKKETFDVERVLKDINKVSLRDLEKAQRAVRSQMKGLTRDTQDYTNKEKDLQKITHELTRARGVMRQKESLWSRMANGVNKYAGVIAGIAATITGIAFSMKEWIKGLVGMDDALADVMKTTGMTRKEVRGMYQDFKTFNTRTPRRELLLLAEEAGRLGKKSRQDVMDFVEVANQIKVALGDDLGGEASVAIREVGKLTNIYKVGEQYSTEFKESMMKVGSAINEVSANSNAQAPFLIDYLKRMGGVADQAGINASKILGYASALDQLGQRQETAATAQGKVMVDMFKDHAKYAEIARMSANSFYELLQTDANEAFLTVLEGLNGNNDGLSLMAKKLDQLGVDGDRATQVLAALASNTELVRNEQALANKAMDEGISLTNEYNVKNNNLAGSYAKIGQYLHSKFINSNFLGWLERVVGKVSEWTEVKLSETLMKERAEMNLLVSSITNVNNTQETRNALIKDLQKTYPDFLGNLDTEKVTNEELRDRLKEVNDEYETKILLAIKEDSLMENYQSRLDLKLKELELIKDIARNEGRLADLRAEQDNEAPGSVKYNELAKSIALVEGNITGYTNSLEKNRSKVAELVEQETELNNAVSELQSKMVNPGSPTNPDPGSNNPKPTGGFDMSFYEPAQDGEIDMGWVTAEIQADAERFAAKQRSEEEWTEFLKQQIDARIAAMQKEAEVEAEIEQAREDLKGMRVDAIGQIAGALSNMFEQGSAAQIALLGLEKASALAAIWINLAKEKAAIGFHAATLGPILGPPYAAAMTAKALLNAKVNTGIIAAQSIAQVVGGKRRSKKEGYYDGGYTGPGGKYEYAGPVHKGEYVIPQEGVQNPAVAQFIDWIEVARRSGSLAQLSIPPQVVKMGSGQRSGYSGGGYTEPTTSQSSIPAPTPIYPDDTELKDLIKKLSKQLDKPIKASVSPFGPNGLDEGMRRVNEFNSKVFKP